MGNKADKLIVTNQEVQDSLVIGFDRYTIKAVNKLVSPHTGNTLRGVLYDARRSNMPLLFKLFVVNKEYNGNHYECNVYSRILISIKERNMCPHLPRFVAYATCSSPNEHLSKSTTKAIKAMSSVANKNKDGSVTYHMLITEYISDSVELARWIEDDSTTIEMVISMVFQVLYTMECFNRIGLRHNDFHYGNILMRKSLFGKGSEDECICYVVYGKNFYLPNIYEPIVIDYDRTYVVSLGANDYLETSQYCIEYGQRNTINEKFDTFKFFSILRKFFSDVINDSDVDTFLNRTISKHIWKKQNGNHIRNTFLCEWKRYGYEEYVPSDDEMFTTRRMLNDALFDRFIKQKQGTHIVCTCYLR